MFNVLRNESQQLDIHVACPALQSQGREDLLWWLHSLHCKTSHHVWQVPFFRLLVYTMAWRSGNVFGHINEVAVCRARLVLGWVTVFGGQTTSVFPQATQANSASYPQLDGKWVPAKVRWCSAAGRYGPFHLWMNVWVAGKTVWSLVNTCHTWAL